MSTVTPAVLGSTAFALLSGVVLTPANEQGMVSCTNISVVPHAASIDVPEYSSFDAIFYLVNNTSTTCLTSISTSAKLGITTNGTTPGSYVSVPGNGSASATGHFATTLSAGSASTVYFHATGAATSGSTTVYIVP